MKKYIGLYVSLVVIAFLLISATVKTNAEAPPQTRVILDHTLGIYVAPPCFNDAEVTNYLEETTYERALQTDYHPYSECTEQALLGEEKPVLFVILEKVGLKTGQWDRDGEWIY